MQRERAYNRGMKKAIHIPEKFKDEKPDPKRRERFSKVVTGLMAVSKLEALTDEKRRLEGAIAAVQKVKRERKPKQLVDLP
jgi:hypothetical protein